MKQLLKYLGIYGIFLVLLTFIFSLLNLIGVNETITNLLIFIFNILAFFFFGIKSGKNANSKGYIAGLKMSGLFLILLLIINIFSTRQFFAISTILYYFILVLAGILGGMIGINKKEDSK